LIGAAAFLANRFILVMAGNEAAFLKQLIYGLPSDRQLV
jgi:hypothetical protein